MKKKLANWVTWYMVTVMFLFAITPKVEAGFSPSEIIGQSQINRSTNVEKIQKFLEIKMVRERLREFGFSPDEIQARLNQLSDPQVHQLAVQIDNAKVGTDDGLGIVITLLVIAILVVILVWLLGHRVVIK